MLIPVDTNRPDPIYRQICDHITTLARTGHLPAGTRLPPTRALAEHLRVHRSTIVNAYDELKACGILVSRQGSGSYIAPGLHDDALVHPSTQSLVPATATATATAALTSEQIVTELWRLNQVEDSVSLALGIPADDMLMIDAFEQARQQVLRRDGAQALTYGSPHGFAPLRTAIAHDLVRHGIRADPEDILITFGAQEALSLVTRALAAPGDAVLCETPTFFASLHSIAHLGMRLNSVPVTASGLEWNCLTQQHAAAARRPRFLLVTPDYHNPTGMQWSLAERQRLLNWAASNTVPIVEDATYRDLCLSGDVLPPLRALDPEVLYIGSFSKSLMPGLRIGFVVANGRLRDHLLLLKTMTSGSNESLGQRTLAAFLASGAYATHIDRVTGVYRQRRDALLNALAATCPASVQWMRPAGGFYVWLTLPPHISAAHVFQRALAAGVLVAPAAAFSPANVSPPNAIRLCFARYPAEVLTAAVRHLGHMLTALDQAAAPII